ncbi:MAG TPA: hypothetical protein VKS79_06835 [Gemmataceae bacterium]|nr:hypothetical protein [Gemmataceae bacterium]
MPKQLVFLAAVVACFLIFPLARGDTATAIRQIKSIQREGNGNEAAVAAVRELSKLGAEAIPEILAGMDSADIVVINWLRGAVEAIAERESAAGKPLPLQKLEAFLKDTKHEPRARRLAFECIAKADPKASQQLLPLVLNDPSAELRREAVAAKLADLRKNNADAAAWKQLLQNARDRDQVEAIVKELKSLGMEIDLTAHWGFITTWKLIGPFDNKGGVGFAKAYPPEEHVDLKGAKEVAATEKLGNVDLNKAIGKEHGVVYYAYTVIESDKEQPAEIRAATPNALKIFVNGQEIFHREEYHHGQTIDQHIGRCTLRKGRNEILVKVCQNEQKEDWAQTWAFQLRVCDTLGAALPVKVGTDGKEKR